MGFCIPLPEVGAEVSIEIRRESVVMYMADDEIFVYPDTDGGSGAVEMCAGVFLRLVAAVAADGDLRRRVEEAAAADGSE